MTSRKLLRNKANSEENASYFLASVALTTVHFPGRRLGDVAGAMQIRDGDLHLWHLLLGGGAWFSSKRGL